MVYQEVSLYSAGAMPAGRTQPVYTVSVDEKPGVQALGLTAPGLPPVVGKHSEILGASSGNHGDPYPNLALEYFIGNKPDRQDSFMTHLIGAHKIIIALLQCALSEFLVVCSTSLSHVLCCMNNNYMMKNMFLNTAFHDAFLNHQKRRALHVARIMPVYAYLISNLDLSGLICRRLMNAALCSYNKEY